MMPAVASPAARSRSTTTTLAPRLAKPSAAARPMPLPAPVINATLPLNSIFLPPRGDPDAILARVGRGQEFPARCLQALPDIGCVRPCHLDAERLEVAAPQHDGNLAEQRARAGIHRERLRIEVQRVERVDAPGGARAGDFDADIAVRDIDDAAGCSP